MNRLPGSTALATAATLAAYALSPTALAHGGADGATLQHYLSSPDHIAVFGILAMAALGACARLARRRPANAPRARRPPC